MSAQDIIRRVRLSPYRKGAGPTFSLTVWDTHRTDDMHKPILGYALRQSGEREPIFTGEDFHCSPCDAIDSDSAIGAILDFLTLRPGDTDAEYFANYTDRQRAFCDEHAEVLGFETRCRFEEAFK